MADTQQTDVPVLRIRPHVTEKSTRLEAVQQYVFKVSRDVNKSHIRSVVEKQFSVKVVAVDTVNVKGKIRRFGKVTGRRKDWKKVYVTLAQGHVIDLSANQPKE